MDLESDNSAMLIMVLIILLRDLFARYCSTDAECMGFILILMSAVLT